MKFEQNWLSGFRGENVENVNGRTHRRTDDGRKVITIAHPEQSSGELKILCGLPLLSGAMAQAKLWGVIIFSA